MTKNVKYLKQVAANLTGPDFLKRKDRIVAANNELLPGMAEYFF